MTQLYLNRIAAYDQSKPGLNAVPIVNPNVLNEAAKLDALRAKGIILGPLHGIPVVVKDSYDVKNLPTTNGLEAFKSLIAPEDAFTVKQLRKAGAVILGKANMATLAGGLEGTTSESYGAVFNPYGLERVPGGSSSGSAVAAAASLALLTMGGETGGSIRVPSANNAVVALKPSLGLISTDGTWSSVPERDVVGPMAKSVLDIAYAMDALVAYDSNNVLNPYIPNVDLIRPKTYISFLDRTALQGKVLGIPRPYIGKGDPITSQSFPDELLNPPLDPVISNIFESAKQILEAQGATLIEADIPAYTTWYTGFPPEGYPVSDERLLLTDAYYVDKKLKQYKNEQIRSLTDLLAITSEEKPYYESLKLFAEITASGQAKPIEELLEVDQALKALAKFRQNQYEDFMSANGIDAFVFPTLNYLAPQREKEDEVYAVYGELPAYLEANVLGVPAITVPMGYSLEGIPVSLEFMGNYLGEGEIISYAYAYEQATKLRRSPELTPSLSGEIFNYEAVAVPEPNTMPGLSLFGLSIMGWLYRKNLRQAETGRQSIEIREIVG
nr:amidase family protein [Nostoc flagelliforme]